MEAILCSRFHHRACKDHISRCELQDEIQFKFTTGKMLILWRTLTGITMQNADAMFQFQTKRDIHPSRQTRYWASAWGFQEIVLNKISVRLSDKKKMHSGLNKMQSWLWSTQQLQLNLGWVHMILKCKFQVEIVVLQNLINEIVLDVVNAASWTIAILPN